MTIKKPAKEKDILYVAEHKERLKVSIVSLFSSVDEAKAFADKKVSRIVFRSKNNLSVGDILSKSEVKQASIYENSGSSIF